MQPAARDDSKVSLSRAGLETLLRGVVVPQPLGLRIDGQDQVRRHTPPHVSQFGDFSLVRTAAIRAVTGENLGLK